MADFRSDHLAAHAHRHEGHDKVVVGQMKRVHVISVKFLSSPGFPGLGFGTVLQMLRVGCQGFAEPNLFTLLNKNQTPSNERNI
jgi:hypothetical protein